MTGEALEKADLAESGIIGDRIVHVRNPAGRIITSRTRPKLLHYRATYTFGGEVLVDGRPWTSAEVARDVEAAADKGTYLRRAIRLTGSISCRC